MSGTEVHPAEQRKLGAAAAGARLSSQAARAQKCKKARERKLADKERDLRVKEQRKLKARRAQCAPRAPLPHATPPDKSKKFQKQLAGAPVLLRRVRAGRAALDALAAKFGTRVAI